MPRSRNKKNHYKNRGQFAGTPKRVIESSAYKSLRGNSAKLLTILTHHYNGYNNGDLAITHAIMKEWLNKNTMYSARDELYEKGFIIGGAVKKLPNLYAITWQPVNDLEAKNGEIRYAHYPVSGPALNYWKTGVNPDYKTQEERNDQYKKDVAKIKKTRTKF